MTMHGKEKLSSSSLVELNQKSCKRIMMFEEMTKGISPYAKYQKPSILAYN